MADSPYITLSRARVTREPEIAVSKNGNQYMKLSFAVNPYKKDRNGQNRDEDPQFYNAIVFDAGYISTYSQYLHKGSMVTVSGYLKPDAYTDQSGIAKLRLQIEYPRIALLLEKARTDTKDIQY